MNVRTSTARLTTVYLGCFTGEGLLGGVVGTISVEVWDEPSWDDQGFSDDGVEDMARGLYSVGSNRVLDNAY